MDSTWITGDHVAAPGSRELTVHKGQQVEIVELPHGSVEMCLVKLLGSGGSETPSEGLVPMAVLKQLPHSRVRASGVDIETGTSLLHFASKNSFHYYLLFLQLSLPVYSLSLSFAFHHFRNKWCTSSVLLWFMPLVALSFGYSLYDN